MPSAAIHEAFIIGGPTGVLWRKPTRKTSVGQAAGTITANGYYQTQLDKKLYYNHRLVAVLCEMLPDYASASHIDHIDGNRTNNNPTNLRKCTVRQNACNKAAHRAGKLPGCVEVHGRWRAQVRVNGHMVYLGTFDSMEGAHATYLCYKELHGLV